MLRHNNFIETKHPILCLPMNGVSDANLAIAVGKAGALASLSLPNYMRDMGKTFLKIDLVRDIARFCEETGSSNMMISMTDHHLFEHYDFLYALFKQFKITHIEIIVMSMADSHYAKNKDSEYIDKLVELKSLGIKIIAKSISFPNDTLRRFIKTEPIMDGILIKGQDGAGKVNTSNVSFSLLSLSLLAVNRYPDKAVIPSGGIATAAQVKNLLAIGCTAVGIGTLFALSEESKVAKSSKLEIIADNKRKLDKLDCEGILQNAFIFKKYEGQDNSNHSISLKLGTEGKGGHLFTGKGISEVNEILPVSEIINRLTDFNV